MEYSIRQLSELAGISARTLRYYDKINLLKPAIVRESGYRYYSQREVELLQQILFYKERGLKLEQIAEILYGGTFDTMSALAEHLEELEKQQERIQHMITAVQKTIASLKGEVTMSNEEKFEVFKKEMINKNEEKYGEELSAKYEKEELEASNQKMLNMTEEKYTNFKNLEEQIHKALESAVTEGASPEGETGKEILRLHRQWLEMTWHKYSVQAHIGVTEMYTADERFQEYYDCNVSGCAEFLKAAVAAWADKL